MSIGPKENLRWRFDDWQKSPPGRERDTKEKIYFDALHNEIEGIFPNFRYGGEGEGSVLGGGAGGGASMYVVGSIKWYSSKLNKEDIPRAPLTWDTWSRHETLEKIPVGRRVRIVRISGTVMFEPNGSTEQLRWADMVLTAGNPHFEAGQYIGVKAGFGRSGGDDHGKFFVDLHAFAPDLTAADVTLMKENKISSCTFRSRDVLLSASDVAIYDMDAGGAGGKLAVNLYLFGV